MKKFFITKVLALLLALCPAAYQLVTPPNTLPAENTPVTQYTDGGDTTPGSVPIRPLDIGFEDDDSN